MSILRPRPNTESEGAVATVRSNVPYSGLVPRCVSGANDILSATFDELVDIPFI